MFLRMDVEGFLHALERSPGMHVDEGMIMAASFFAIGFAVAWHNGRVRIGFLAQFVAATMALRYIESFAIFHRTLLEGSWPILWGASGVLGAWAASLRERRKAR